MAKKSLGKGLDALFIDNSVDIEKDERGGEPVMVRLSSLEPDEAQPRKKFSVEAIEELSESIKEHGVISPLIVRPSKGEGYTIVAGERRWRAARLAGLKELPVIVRNYTDRQCAEIALVENLQREDLNPVEEAAGYKRLMEEYKLTQEEVASRVGKSRPAVANALRLMSLPADVLEMVGEGEISAGHARAIISLGEKAGEAARRIVKEGMSVRGAEKLAKRLSTEDEKPAQEKPLVVDYTKELEERLSSALSRRVRVAPGQKGGKIELTYYNADDLESLIGLLEGALG